MFDKNDRGMSRFFTGFARNRYNSVTTRRGLDGQFILGMSLAVVAVVILWWTPLLFPFRIFTTAVHETSHALAALATGATPTNIELFWNGGGVTYILGVNGLLGSIVVYSAGYLGTVMFGGLLLLQSKKPMMRRRVLWGIVVVLLVITVFYIRAPQSLLMVAIVAGLAGLVAYKGPDLVVMFSVYVLALLCCLNSLTDLFYLILSTGNPFHTGFNDAMGLQAATGIPAFIWALAWGLLGAFMMFVFVRQAIRRTPASASSGPGLGKGSGNGKALDPFAPSRNGSTSASPFDRYDDYLSKK